MILKIVVDWIMKPHSLRLAPFKKKTGETNHNKSEIGKSRVGAIEIQRYSPFEDDDRMEDLPVPSPLSCLSDPAVGSPTMDMAKVGSPRSVVKVCTNPCYVQK